MNRLAIKILTTFFIISSLPLLSWIRPGYAFDPDEVVVVANGKVAESISLAEFYMEQRAISKKNLIVVQTNTDESCSPSAYEKQIREPIRRYLKSYTPRQHIRCLVLMYGIPLRVNPPPADAARKREMEALEKDMKRLEKQIEETGDKGSSQKDALEDALSALKHKQRLYRQAGETASVDSELMLVMADDYQRAGWVVNPYFIGAMNRRFLVSKNDVRLVSRLDGPSPAIVRRMIQDTLEAERQGLSGKAYFDARWQKSKKLQKKPSGYKLYDHAIHQAASAVEESGRMPVILESTEKLFQSGQAPDAALYCGWYSLGRYVNAFDWQPGAVGFHIASSECTTLKKRNSQVWCKRMLEEGVAATIGPVDEPYVNGFPLPNVFFGFLVDGYMTLAECYLVSLPHLSWKMVLIGDPLYRPFKNMQ